jgi:hypothetical protein
MNLNFLLEKKLDKKVLKSIKTKKNSNIYVYGNKVEDQHIINIYYIYSMTSVGGFYTL